MSDDVEKKEPEQLTEPQSKPYRWGVIEPGILIAEVGLDNPHMAIGILEDACQYLLDMIATKRMQQQLAEKAKKDILEGKDTIAQEAIKNRGFFKKHFSK